MREMIKSSLVLCLITVIAAAALAVAYDVTKEPIRRQQVITGERLMRELFPDAATFWQASNLLSWSNIYAVSGDTGDIIGYIISVSSQGYSGRIGMLVGLDTHGVVTGTRVVSQSETPGLGTRATDTEFLAQFVGTAQPLTVVTAAPVTHTEVQAITGATISVRAVVEGVNEAIRMFDDVSIADLTFDIPLNGGVGE